jgi:cysteinyl-tRNA synthetase
MHKSVGNVVYVRDLVKAGWSPRTIRMFLVSSSYRDPLDLTDTSLEQARAQTTRLSEFVGRLKSADSKSDQGSGLAKALVADFEGAMDEDLNTPKAFSILFTFVKKMNTLIDSDSVSAATAVESIEALKKVDSVLGVVEFGEDQTLEPELAALLVQRDAARKRRDFSESDRLRKELLSRGVEVEDTPRGTRWKRVSRG